MLFQALLADQFAGRFRGQLGDAILLALELIRWRTLTGAASRFRVRI